MTLNLAHSAFIASAHNPTHSILTPVPSLPRSTHARPPRNPQPACPSCGGVRCLRSKPLSLVPHRRTIVAPSDAFLPPPPPSPPVCRDGQGARCDANSCCQLPPPPPNRKWVASSQCPPTHNRASMAQRPTVTQDRSSRPRPREGSRRDPPRAPGPSCRCNLHRSSQSERI